MALYSRKFIHSALEMIITAATLASSGVTYAQEDAAEGDKLEEVIVTGLRSSQERSIDLKRDANSVVDSITATDIGKLPDVTIADSLQRVTGVQIRRSGGEGDIVNIRGVAQVMTTLNGEQMLSAGSVTTVQPNYADIPSTLLNGVDVYKSTEARLLNGGISGVVNLRTYRPFQMDEGFTTIAKVEVTDGSMGDETDHNIMLFGGYNSDNNWGATFNLSTSESNLANYRISYNGDDWAYIASEAESFMQPNLDINGDGDTNDVFYNFEGHQAGNEFIVRDRIGANGSFQANLTESWSLTADMFYTEMEEHQNRAAFDASEAFEGYPGWFIPTQTVAHEHITSSSGVPAVQPGNLYSVQSATYQSIRVQTHTETANYDRESLNTNLEFNFDNGGPFRANFRLLHGEARNDRTTGFVDSYITSGEQGTPGNYHTYNDGDDTTNLEFISDVNPWGYDGYNPTLPDGTELVGAGYTQSPIGIAYEGGVQKWTLPTTNLRVNTTYNSVPGDYVVVNEVFGSNVDRYSVTSAWYTGTNQYAEMDVARADFSFDMDAAGVKKVDLGVRYGVREVEQVDYSGEGIFTNGYGDPFIAQWKDSGTSAPLTGESYIPPISFNDSRLQGKTVQISDFQGTQGLGNLWFIDPEALYNPREFHELLYGTQAEVPIPERTFELEETTSTFYVQADFEDLFGWNLNGNIGVRVVQTEFDITQNEATNEEVITINGVDYLRGPGAPFPMGTPVTVKRDYTDTLPALNLSYDLTDNQKLRFAYNSAVTTHDALNLAGGLSINRIIACNIQTSAGEDVFCAVGGNALGNPDLEPWRSDNYDLSYEWYFSDSGLLSVGYFYIDIESFIFTSVVYRDDIPDSDGVIRGYDAQSQQLTGLVPISASVNSEEGASIQGLEIGYRQAFDFLDGWVNGFGLDANFTYSPSDSGLFDYYGEENTLMDNSEKQFNLAIWYDKYSWEARLAGNYRSKTYLYNTAQGDYVFAKFRKPTTYVDASIAYHLGDAWTFSLLATNITEESLEDYYQWEDLFANHFINERRITLGAQFRM